MCGLYVFFTRLGSYRKHSLSLSKHSGRALTQVLTHSGGSVTRSVRPRSIRLSASMTVHNITIYIPAQSARNTTA